MHWFRILLIAFFAVQIGFNLAIIDKLREPITPGMILLGMAIDALIIWGIAVLP